MSIESWARSQGNRPYVGVVVRALLRGLEDPTTDMAASMAYFGFFSLFPLFLGLAVIASLRLDPTEVQAYLDRLLADLLPRSAELVRANLEALVRLRGAAGIASAAGLLWSASKMFGAVSRGINGALGLRSSHSVLFSPFRNFFVTVTVSFLLLACATVPTTLGFLAQLEVGLLGSQFDALLGSVRSYAASYAFVVVVFATLYRIVPYRAPSWREVLPGALFSAVFYELGKTCFVLYVDNATHLHAIYGSLASIIVLLLWLYFSARVLLLGADLMAVRREKAAEQAELVGEEP